MTRRERILLCLIGGIASGAVLLQGGLTWGYCAARGMSPAATLSKFFSYFTVLTNTLLAVSCLSRGLLPASAAARFFGRPGVRTALLLYIGTVGAVYVAVLQSEWNPRGWQWIADIALHYATPILYLLYWIRFGRQTPVPWTAAFWWLLYPLGYLACSLIRGPLAGDYPYPFIDLHRHSGFRVALNVVVLSGLFLAGAFALIFVSRDRRPAGSPARHSC